MLKALSNYLSLAIALIVVSAISTASIIAVENMEKSVREGIREAYNKPFTYNRIHVNGEDLVLIRFRYGVSINDIIVVDRLNNTVYKISYNDLLFIDGCRAGGSSIYCGSGSTIAISIQPSYRLVVIADKGVYVV